MEHSVRAYDGLAAIYDFVMRHVDYASWAAYVTELLARCACSPDAVLDIACGTGSVTLELAASGLPVTHGVDQSEAMLRVARERAVLAGLDITFEARDLRALAGLGSFDAVVCMYDSLNYMLDDDEVEDALSAVQAVLTPGGLFIFDVCTERNSLRYFRDTRDQDAGPGFRYERHSYYNPADRLQVNDFVLHFEDQDAPVREHHEQRIYRLDSLRSIVGRTDFQILGVHDGFSMDPGTEDSDRVHFVLRRTALPGECREDGGRQ